MTPAATLAVVVEAHTGKAERALKDFNRKVSEADREKATATLEGEVERGGFEVFDRLVDKADREEATATLKADADTKLWRDEMGRLRNQAGRFASDAEKAAAGMDGFGNSTDRARTKLDLFDFSIGKTNRNFMFMRNSMKLIKWPALITGAGVAAQGLSAAAAGATALSGALAPSIGLATQYATALGVLGQVAGVMAFAQINDLTQALGGNEEALKRLSPAARQFVNTLQTFKPQLDSIRAAVQKPLFAGLTSGLREAMKNFGPFRTVLRGTARVLGNLAERFGGFLGSKGFGQDLQKIGGTNNRVLSRMGHSAINLAHALVDVMVVARPLTNWLSRMALGWTKNVKAQAEAGRKSGALADFFKETRQVVARLVSLLGNFGGALWNIMRIGKPLGDTILKQLDKSAKTFKDWTESAKGKNEIAQWFEDAKRPLMALGKLAGDVTKAFFRLAATPGLTKLITSLDRELLPVLVRLIRITTKAFAPVLIDLAISWAKVLGDLAGTSGPLTLLAKAMTLIGDAIHRVFKASPLVKTLTVNLLGLYAVIKAIGLFSAFSQLAGFKRGLSSLGITAKQTATQVRGLHGAVGRIPVAMSQASTSISRASGTFKTKGAQLGQSVTLGVSEGMQKGAGGGTFRGKVVSSLGRGFARAKPALKGIGGGLVATGVISGVYQALADNGLKRDVAGRFQDFFSGLSFGLIPSTAQAASELAQQMSATIASLRPGKVLGNITSEGEIVTARLRNWRDASKSLNATIKDRLPILVREGKLTAEDAAQIRAQAQAMRDNIRDFTQGLRFLRSGAAASMGDVNRVVKQNAEAISQTLGENSKRGREKLAANFRAGADAVREAMKRGDISTKQGMARIRQLITKAKIADPTREQARAFGDTWAKGLDRSKEITKDGVRRIIDQLGKLPGAARRIAFRTAMNHLREARREGDITAAEYRKIKSRILAQYTDLADRAKDKTRQMSDDLRNIIAETGEAIRKFHDFGSGVRRPHVVPGRGHVAGAATGGLVTDTGIRYLAAGGPARGTDTVPAMLTPGEFVMKRKAVKQIGVQNLQAMNKGGVGLEGAHGKKLLDTTKKVTKETAKAMVANLGKGNREASKNTEDFVKKHNRLLGTLKDTGAKLTQRFRQTTVRDFEQTKDRGTLMSDRLKTGVGNDFDRMRQQAGDQAGKLKQNVVEQFSRTRESTVKSTQKMEAGAAGNYRDLVGAVNDGLSKIAQMTNAALKALGVKKVDFNIGVQKGKGHKRGGHIDAPGAPPTGDHIPAMLEKGEFVVNKKAAAKHRDTLEKINWHDAPRFQAGGTAGMQPEAASLARNFVSRFGGSISSGLRAGDTGSLHSQGLAFDWVGGDWDAATRFANQIGAQLLEGIHQAPPGQNVSWDSGQRVSPSFWGGATWAAHVSHVHVATAKKIAGAVVKEIKRVTLKGPEGPMTDTGQGVLDRVRDASNKLIERKSASSSMGLEGVSVATGPIQEMAHEMVRKIWGESQWPPFVQLEMSEAGWNPRAQNPSSGAAGLAQALPPSKYPPGAWPYRGLESAKLQLQWMMGYIKERYGDPSSAWSFHQANNWYQRGGTVGDGIAYLKQGGGAKGDDKKPKTKPVADLGLQKVLHLAKDKGNERQDEALKELLERIHEAQKGAPVKEFGRLHKWTEKLSYLELKHKYHPKSKHTERQLNSFVKDHGKDLIHQLTNRKEKYKQLLQKKALAKHTPGEKDDERSQEKIDKFLGDTDKTGLLAKIRKARKGVPIKPYGHLFKYLNELDVLELKKDLHPKSDGAKRDLHHFLKDEGRYILSTLKRRAKLWGELQIRKKIAAKTPGKEDDERIAKLIAEFTGKKPGAGDPDQVAKTQQFFDFLKLLGPTTAISAFAKGGTIRPGQLGLVGEKGPELIQGPGLVHSTAQTQQMLQPSFEVHVYVGDKEITDIVRVEMREKDRKDNRDARAGASLSR